MRGVNVSLALYLCLSLAVVDGRTLKGSYSQRPGMLIGTQLVATVNNDITNTETLIDGQTYAFDPSKGYSVMAETTGSITSVEFFTDDGERTEFVAPYLLAGDKDGKVNPSQYLSTCGPKSVTIMGKYRKEVLFEESFSFELECIRDQPLRCDNNGYSCPEYSLGSKDCVMSFDDCVCDAGFEKEGGECLLPCHNDGFTCSTNSHSITSCPMNDEDCECNTAFTCPVGSDPTIPCPRAEMDCTGDCADTGYACPAYSHSIADCVRSFDDCECKSGFEKSGDTCIPGEVHVVKPDVHMAETPVEEPPAIHMAETPCNNGGFDCPSNSYPLISCPASEQDCQCDTANFACPVGFTSTTFCPVSDADCKCDSSFACPTGQVGAVACPTSEEDCVCEADPIACPPGWLASTMCPQTVEHDCERECGSCPDSAYPTSPCVTSFNDDCECNHGFAKAEGQCVEDPAVQSSSTLCTTSFSCPENSVSSIPCPQSIEDCDCEPDYFKSGDRCDSCFVPGCKWMETYDIALKRCVRIPTFPKMYTRSFTCPKRSYTVRFRNTGTMLDCECNCFKTKNICTGWCTESCSSMPLQPGQ